MSMIEKLFQSRLREFQIRISERADQDWSLTTTSATANQSIGTYTPKKGVAYVVQLIFIEASLTTLSTTEKVLGDLSVRWGGAAFHTSRAINDASAGAFGYILPFANIGGVFFGDGAKALDAVCSPSDTTSMKWRVNMLGGTKILWEKEKLELGLG